MGCRGPLLTGLPAYFGVALWFAKVQHLPAPRPSSSLRVVQGRYGRANRGAGLRPVPAPVGPSGLPLRLDRSERGSGLAEVLSTWQRTPPQPLDASLTFTQPARRPRSGQADRAPARHRITGFAPSLPSRVHRRHLQRSPCGLVARRHRPGATSRRPRADTHRQPLTPYPLSNLASSRREARRAGSRPGDSPDLVVYSGPQARTAFGESARPTRPHPAVEVSESRQDLTFRDFDSET